jgi:hypothetical protein
VLGQQAPVADAGAAAAGLAAAMHGVGSQTSSLLLIQGTGRAPPRSYRAQRQAPHPGAVVPAAAAAALAAGQGPAAAPPAAVLLQLAQAWRAQQLAAMVSCRGRAFIDCVPS